MKISPLGQLNQLSLNGIAILLQASLDYEKKDDLAMVASWQKNWRELARYGLGWCDGIMQYIIVYNGILL